MWKTNWGKEITFQNTNHKHNCQRVLAKERGFDEISDSREQCVCWRGAVAARWFLILENTFYNILRALKKSRNLCKHFRISSKTFHEGWKAAVGLSPSLLWSSPPRWIGPTLPEFTYYYCDDLGIQSSNMFWWQQKTFCLVLPDILNFCSSRSHRDITTRQRCYKFNKSSTDTAQRLNPWISSRFQIYSISASMFG